MQRQTDREIGKQREARTQIGRQQTDPHARTQTETYRETYIQTYRETDPQRKSEDT